MMNLFKRFLEWLGIYEPVNYPEPKEPINKPTKKQEGLAFLQLFDGLHEDERSEFLSSLWADFGRPDYNEKTNWCGLAIAWAEFETGHLLKEEIPKGFESSRAWLNQFPRDKYKLLNDFDKMEIGDIVVRWRGQAPHGGRNGWQGHIAYFNGYIDNQTYWAYGGNQDDSISNRKCYKNMILGVLRRK